MSGALVPRTTMAMTRADSRAIRALDRFTDLALARDDNEASLYERRIGNGYALAQYTAIKAVRLNGLITDSTPDNVQLELVLREFERGILLDAGALIGRYLRP